MDFDQERPFSGDAARALDTARRAFIDNGFEVTTVRDLTFEARRKGIVDRGHSGVAGVSYASVSARSGSAVIQAEFGCIRRTVLCTAVFLLALFAFFLILFTVLFGFDRALPHSALPFSPWPVLLPLLAVIMRRRTAATLRILLDNMANAAQDA